MKFLRGIGWGLGAILLALAVVVNGMVPGHGTYVLVVGAFGLALVLAGLLLNRDRVTAALQGKKARAAGASAGYALTVLAVIVLVNFLAARHHKRFDLTENKAFSLSEQTIKILESLPREVTVTAFYREAEPTRQKLEDLLAEYRYHSPKLTVRYIDPDTHPGDAKLYSIAEYGTIVVESGKNESRTNTPDEESLTNALIKVTKDRERIVYFTTGHGERDLSVSERNGLSLLKGELEKQHYTVKPLVLSQGMPQDATVVVIAGPQKSFLEAEIRMIQEYLQKGGHMLYLQDPETDPGLGSVLAAYGVSVRNDVVVDKVSRLFGGDYLVPLVPADGYDEFHPITKTFRFQTFFPAGQVSSIRISSPWRFVFLREQSRGDRRSGAEDRPPHSQGRDGSEGTGADRGRRDPQGRPGEPAGGPARLDQGSGEQVGRRGASGGLRRLRLSQQRLLQRFGQRRPGAQRRRLARRAGGSGFHPSEDLAAPHSHPVARGSPALLLVDRRARARHHRHRRHRDLVAPQEALRHPR